MISNYFYGNLITMVNQLKIKVNEPLIIGNEKKYLLDCLSSGYISSGGDFVKEFESKFAKRVNRKYGISVSNGTAAIQLAFESLNLKKGDEVILPSFTIISCILPIVRAGLTPVLVDSDLKTWNMDVNQVEKKITCVCCQCIMCVLLVDKKPSLLAYGLQLPDGKRSYKWSQRYECFMDRLN